MAIHFRIAAMTRTGRFAIVYLVLVTILLALSDLLRIPKLAFSMGDALMLLSSLILLLPLGLFGAAFMSGQSSPEVVLGGALLIVLNGYLWGSIYSHRVELRARRRGHATAEAPPDDSTRPARSSLPMHVGLIIAGLNVFGRAFLVLIEGNGWRRVLSFPLEQPMEKALAAFFTLGTGSLKPLYFQMSVVAINAVLWGAATAAALALLRWTWLRCRRPACH
ncbi:MAG: hypothetical protein ABFD92_07020 [Planctomycetaceae bacterium]|nr:hypothetical protein [Planctomycetaceae bacterium]